MFPRGPCCHDEMHGDLSVAKVLVDKQHVRRRVCWLAIMHHRDLADAVGRVAVGADSSGGTRSLFAETPAVRRAGAAFDAGDCVIKAALDYLVSSYDEHHLFGAEDGRRHAIAVAVDIHKAPIGSERIGAEKEKIAIRSVVADFLA